MVNATIDLLTNATGLYDLGSFANYAANNMFWAIIMICIYIIFIVKLYPYGIERALAAASFSCLMMSLPLMYLQWLNLAFPIVFTIALAASLAYIRFSESN